MDIERQVNSRRWPWIAALIGAVAIVAIVGSFGLLSGGEGAVPELDRDLTWIGEVRRGSMSIEIRSPGRLVPEEERWITAPAEGVVERVLVESGDRLERHTVLLELSNPELQRALFEAGLDIRSERAAASAARARLDNEILDLEASMARLAADRKEAELRLATDEALSQDGLVSSVDLEVKRYRVEELSRRFEIETERLQRRRSSLPTELAAAEVRVEKSETLLAYLQREVDSLSVRAQTAGILAEILPQSGSRVALGQPLAKVIDPTRLRAELDVPQVRAREVRVGQRATIDTRNTKIRGTVTRIDPSVQDGVVRVDVDPDEPWPADARASLRVDGTIEIEQLGEVLFTRRPLDAREGATMDLFRLEADGERAVRVRAELGRMSVNTVQLLSGLNEGDRVILSDVSQFGDAKGIRIR